jgi:hypothetical protein
MLHVSVVRPSSSKDILAKITRLTSELDLVGVQEVKWEGGGVEPRQSLSRYNSPSTRATEFSRLDHEGNI